MKGMMTGQRDRKAIPEKGRRYIYKGITTHPI
jgi:hypothetical protein